MDRTCTDLTTIALTQQVLCLVTEAAWFGEEQPYSEVNHLLVSVK